jgi:surface protein
MPTPTKRERQDAKLTLAGTDRIARNVIEPGRYTDVTADATQLPTRYAVGDNNTNNLVINPNISGLLPGRPWNSKTSLASFDMTVRTTAANETFTVPCQNVGTFNATIDWGDGSSSTIATYNDSNLTHTYASAGDHAISISGTFPNIKFGIDSVAADKVIAVTNLGQVGWQILERAFRNCDKMTSFTSGVTDTSSVTNMHEIFYGCNDMTSADVSGFNTSSVTNMIGMFRYCYALASLTGLNTFNTSSVTNMSNMFFGCNSLTSLDVSSFNTSSVTSMFYMFINCSSLTSLNVSNFDTSSVANMGGMFYGCSSLTDVVGVENFDIEGFSFTSGLTNFMNVAVTLPTSRYDALLVNWDAQDPFDGMSPNFGSSQYTAGGTAAAARANLISTDGWTITDGGNVPVPFAMTVRTTAANETFAIPCGNVGTFNATVDWGDGSTSAITAYNDSDLTHTYASSGDHSISISGTFPNIKFGNNSTNAGKVITVTNLGTVGWQSFEAAFKFCGNMTSFNVGVTDTSSVTSMYQMFNGCHLLTTLDLSHFDTSSVTNMNRMFNMIRLQTVDVSSFDTSSVTDMSHMFHVCRDLTTLDLSHFDTSSVTDMSYMFNDNEDLTSLNVSSFNTSSVTTMRNMFASCESLTSLDVSGFNTSSVSGFGMSNMFERMYDLTSLDVSGFNTSSVTGFFNMFNNNVSLTSLDVSSFDTSSSVGFDSMFYGCNSLTSLDVSGFNTSSATSMYHMFYGCNSLTSLDVSGFNTSSVTSMQAMFASCSGLTSLNVSSFNTSSVTSMLGMFTSCSSLTDVVGVENFNIEALNHTYDFNTFMLGVTLPTARYDALLINWDAQDPFDGMSPHFGNSQYTAGGTAAAARANLISNDNWTISDGGTAPPVPFAMTVRTTAANETFTIPCQDVGTFNASVDWGDGSSSTVTTYNDADLVHTYASAGDHAISISGTFPNINFADAGDKSKVIAVTNLGQVGWQSFIDAFYGCGNMTSFTSGVTDTSSVTSMLGMFSSCASLTSLDLSNFDTSSVTDMDFMFSGTTQLQSVDVSSFDTSSVTTMYQMFVLASSLTSLDVSSFNTSSVTNMSGMFWVCSSLTSLNISNFNTSSVTTMENMFENCNNVTDIVGVENFDIEGITSGSGLTSFMIGVTLPTSRYDALLINWDAQDPLDSLFPYFGGSQYTAGGTAAAARANLISNDNWTIQDGGTA